MNMSNKVMLDTNILYYWSEITSSNYNVKRIEESILKLGNPVISELTILEAFVNFRNNKSSLRKLYGFLVSKNIGIIPYANFEYPFLTKDLENIL